MSFLTIKGTILFPDVPPTITMKRPNRYREHLGILYTHFNNVLVRESPGSFNRVAIDCE